MRYKLLQISNNNYFRRIFSSCFISADKKLYRTKNENSLKLFLYIPVLLSFSERCKFPAMSKLKRTTRKGSSSNRYLVLITIGIYTIVNENYQKSTQSSLSSY